jgi:hypothetical protein
MFEQVIKIGGYNLGNAVLVSGNTTNQIMLGCADCFRFRYFQTFRYKPPYLVAPEFLLKKIEYLV